MKSVKAWQVGVGAGLVLGLTTLGVVRSILRSAPVAIPETTGDLSAQHAPVSLAGRAVNGPARLRDGDEVATGADGRARVRLDDGLFVVVDADTRFTLRGHSLKLEAGRIFVQGDAFAHTRVEIGDASTEVSSSAAAFEFAPGKPAKVYCAQGELLLRKGSHQERVSSGETATLSEKGPSVTPEVAFNDWTGGLAVPWTSSTAPRALIPELRARPGSDGNAQRAAIAVKSQNVDVSIEGEFAITRTRTSYFNGSESPVAPEVRLALPPSAILSRVARRADGQESEAALVVARPGQGDPSAFPGRLEWAGNGWLRGALPPIASGSSVDLELTYAEWLPTAGGRRSYRFPLTGDDTAPLLGEFRSQVTARSGETRFLSTNAGSRVQGRRIEFVRSDFRPSADLVVELAAARGERRAARAYVAPGSNGEDPYVLIRTELPERHDPGLCLAVVVDASMSVGAGTLEAERALVEALLEGLGARDEIVVLAADQSVRALGSEAPRAVTPELRGELAAALAAVRPGGASNLGQALERGADLLDAEQRGARAGSGVLVYIGDGRPSVGAADVESLRRRLAQRDGGMPRLASVAVGSAADRFFLARLTNGIGRSYEAVDRADSARVGAALLADALEPTLRDVEFDLGPHIDRVYPREARSIVAGSTLSVVGRVRGPLPKQIGIFYREGRQRIREQRPVDQLALPSGADLPQRWVSARIEEIAARGDGVEPSIALAASARLLTPWTGWYFVASPGAVPGSELSQRVLELSPRLDAPFARYLSGGDKLGSALLEPRPPSSGGQSLRRAAEIAVSRILRQASQSVRACRDARAAVRPNVAQRFSIDLALGQDGHVLRLHVEAGEGSQRDAVLERCVEGVVRSLPYFALGIGVNVTEVLMLPKPRAARRTVCSEASRLSLPIRRAVWRERGFANLDGFVRAAESCEFKGFSEKREYLLLMLESTPVGSFRLDLANKLDELGEVDAATFVRKETLRRVTSFAELEELSRALASDEPDVDIEFEKAYGEAPSNEKRLEVVHKFLRLAPHAPLLRRRLFGLLEALGHKDELVSAIATLRGEAVADAGLLALAASTLRRVGLDAEGRRAFGELLERAPSDPWTLAFVGDRLRAEHLFDGAADAYESLRRLMPGDASVSLRLALAHAGAGRLDVATRLLESVTRTGGSDDDGRMGELASITSAVLLASARERSVEALEGAELLRRLAETPLPDVASILWVQSSPADDTLQIRVSRERGEREARALDFEAPALGLAATRVERGDGSTWLVFRREKDAGPARPIHAEVAALVLNPESASVRIVRREVELEAGATTLEVRWNGEAFL